MPKLLPGGIQVPAGTGDAADSGVRRGTRVETEPDETVRAFRLSALGRWRRNVARRP